MEKGRLFISISIVFIFLATEFSFALTLGDGGTYDIDFTLTGPTYVRNHTTINLITGGQISQYNSSLTMEDDSMLNVTGGAVNGVMYAYDTSQITMSSGLINTIYTRYDSRLTMSGGTLYFLHGYENSHIDISGGSVHSMTCQGNTQIYWSGGKTITHKSSSPTINSKISLDDNAKLIISGYDFAVDGEPVDPGTLVSFFGSNSGSDPSRHLTGFLANGDLIDTYYQLGHSSSIVLVPEPATLLLFSIGIIKIRRWH